MLIALLSLLLAAVAGLGLVVRRQRRALIQLRASDHRLHRELRGRLNAEHTRRNELEALLASMSEGVIAVDTAERVIKINQAAMRLTRPAPGGVIGRPIQEVLRSSALQSLIARALHGDGPCREQLTLLPLDPAADTAFGAHLADAPASAASRHLDAQAVELRDGTGVRLGAVVVLHDVTQLRRLEAVRREFVANVSHEIRTPIASIRAAIETLMDTDDAAPIDPASAQRLHRVVARQAVRLEDIVEDLLTLARIEAADSEDAASAPALEPTPLAGVLRGAAETCAANARARQIRVEVADADGLSAMLLPRLAEQALVNLIDNAINYSEEGGTVSIDAGESPGGLVRVRVTDHGRGIEAMHLPRIFERFYRTDAARSRRLGGTGLGLAIVRHIADLHGGAVRVESHPGRGSTFTLTFQAAGAAPVADPNTDRVEETVR